MKWKTAETPKEPKLGDLKTKTIFAVLPHACTDGYTRWLENIEVEYIYREQSGGDMMMPEYWNAWERNKYHALSKLS